MSKIFQIIQNENGESVLEKYTGEDADVIIPEGVTKIGWGAFKDCKRLTSVVIPLGVTEIGENTFAGCTRLKSVRFHNGLTRIGKDAFKGCSLSEINLPSSVREIDQDAFKLNASVSEVNVVYRHNDNPGDGRPGFLGLTINLLDENRTRIAKLYCWEAKGYDSFFGKLLCGGVKHLSLYDKLSTIFQASADQKGKLAALRLAYPYELDEKFKQEYIDYLKKNGRFIIPSIIEKGDIEVLTIMASCGALSEKRIQEYIDQANKSQKTEVLAYLMNYKNKHFALPKDLTLEIKPAKLSDSWVSRKNEDDTLTITKYRGKDLAVEIPAMIGDNKVSKIGLGQPLKSLFYDHPKIQGVKILEGIQEINDGSFIDCYEIQSVEIPNSIVEIGSHAFSGCRSLTSILLPQKLKRINCKTFEYCGLTSVMIPPSVTYIGERAFYACRFLTSINIPDGIDRIDSFTFSECQSLNSVTLPEGLTQIYFEAFSQCKSLTTLVIPQSVTTIWFNAFWGCQNLVIHALKGSFAIQYAKKRIIKYVEL